MKKTKPQLYRDAADVTLQVTSLAPAAVRAAHAPALKLLQRLTDSGTYTQDGEEIVVRGRKTKDGHVPEARLENHLPNALKWVASVHDGQTRTTFTLTGSRLTVAVA